MRARSSNGLWIAVGDYVLPAHGGEFKCQQGVVISVAADETCGIWWDGRDDIPGVWNAVDLVKMPKVGERVCVREFSDLGLMYPNVKGSAEHVQLVDGRLEIWVRLDNSRLVAGPVNQFEWEFGGA